jgi:hypothetical protein
MSREEDAEPVGYKRPPKHSQFKKGRSGNPSGKPRRAKSAAVDEREAVLSRIVTTRINGKVVRISVRRALYETAADKAFKGDMRALALLLKDDGCNDNDAQAMAEDRNAAEEEALIERYVARKAKKVGGADE